jgi:hypothetical protein
LPANVLIADPESDWLRIAIPLTVEQDLAASSNTIPFLAASESAALQGKASEVLRITAEDYRGRLRLTSTFTDPVTQRANSVLTLEAPAADAVIPLVNALAKRIDPAASSFAMTGDRALRLFSQAAQTQNSNTRIDLLRLAIAADPHFGLAYVALLNALAPAGQQAVGPVLEAADANAASFAPIDRARFAAIRFRLSHAAIADQERADAAVLKYTPNDSEELALVASDLYLQGDGTEGDRLMKRALSLSNGNANIRLQYVRGLIETRRFREAEKILTELDSNPSVLADLASCVLLQGDKARADSIAQRFIASLPGADLKTWSAGLWLAISGNFSKAVLAVEKGTFRDTRIRSLAFSEAALWAASTGDFGGAQKLAAYAGQNGASPVAEFARLLSRKPTSPEAWRAEVRAISSNPADEQARQVLIAYGLFVFGFYSDSANAWQAVVNQTGNTDLPSRAMLAASLGRTGRAADAAQVKVEPFVPDLENFYAAIPFNQMRALLR